MKELSSCIIEKFNGFNIVCVEFSKKLRQPFRPINIIYKPVKKCDKIINCYFSKKLNMAFHSSFSEGTKIRYGTAGNAIFAQIITVEKINMIAMLKMVQVVQVTSIILIRKVR